MASEIRVDKITSLSGVGTITPSSSGIDITGITTVATLKATTGIVTTLTATTGIVTTLTANTVTSLGAVSGTTGTFSGAVSGTTGTFTGDVSIADAIVHTDDNSKIRFPSNDTITFETSGSEGIRVDAGGRLLVGSTAARTSGGAAYAHLQVEGTDSPGAEILVIRNSNDSYSSTLGLVKTRGTSDGAVTTVQDNDSLGTIQFRGADGSDIYSVAASITGEVDGSPSDGTDMPGALVFGTTADGSSSPTERVRITSSGLMGVGTNSPSDNIHISESGATNNYIRFSNSNISNGWSVGAQSGGRFQIVQNGVADRFFIESDGNITVNSGNLIMGTSGKGIDFSAAGNASGMTSELLDDYEEGTFTPTLLGQLSGQSYSNQVGQYTKIGNVVVVNVYLKLAGDPGSYASGVSIGGLPFTGINNNALAGAGVLAYQAGAFPSTGANANFTAMVNPDDNVMKLYSPDGTFLLWSEMNNRTKQMRFNITYRTAT
mgnify:CR=1 FL=1